MSALHTTHDLHREDRPLSSWLHATLLIIATVLLVAGVTLSAVLYRQSRAVEESVDVTRDVIEANVRTLGQAQREVLRLRLQLEIDPSDRDRIDLLSSFVEQRLHEGALPYQLKTLGDQDLLDRTAALADRWPVEIQPLVDRAVDQPNDGPLITTLDVLINDFELELNQVISDGEINRKATAAEAQASAIHLLHTTRLVLFGMVAVSAGFVVFATIGARLFWRYNRQRERSQRELISLVRETHKLSLVASSTDNVVIITDADGVIEWTNAAFTKQTGYQLDDVVGRKPGSFLQGPDTDPELIVMMREHIAAGEAFYCEIINYRRDGSPFRSGLAVQPVRDDDGAVTNFIALQSDVTERHETEERLRSMKEAAEELAQEKSNFLASMSHEIRTPLNALLGLTELLLTTELDDRQREYASTAYTSGKILLETVNNVLDFSALESGRAEIDVAPYDLRSLIGDVADTLAPEARRRMLELHVEVDRDIPAALLGDAPRVQQILVNIVSNAIKFTEIGSVSVNVTATASEDGLHDLAVIRVTDTGIGIPADRLDRLFMPFSQADSSISSRFGGTGLGLAISRHLAIMLGATLTIASEESVGTVVELSIPLVPAETQVTEVEQPSVRAVDGSTPRVLVAEDDPVNRHVIEHMLRQLGQEVDFAHNGAIAVNECIQSEYDLVLMDVQMPEMDGVDATRRIRSSLPAHLQPMIVALTASALVGDKERFLDAGMDGYLSKPVQIKDLGDVLDQLRTTRTRRTERSSQHIDDPQPEPIDFDALSAHFGGDRSAHEAIDELLPILLGRVNQDVTVLRSLIRDARLIDAGRAVTGMEESSRHIGAMALHDSIRLLKAAIGSERATAIDSAIDSVANQVNVLRAWYVDRSIAAVIAG